MGGKERDKNLFSLCPPYNAGSERHVDIIAPEAREDQGECIHPKVTMVLYQLHLQHILNKSSP